jgi:hypothetical protein
MLTGAFGMLRVYVARVVYFVGRTANSHGFHSFPFSNSATSAAWRIDAPAARVSVERAGAVFTVKNNAGIARLFQPCAARYSIEFNIIAGVYPGAALGAPARIFCAHAFNCHLVAFSLIQI